MLEVLWCLTEEWAAALLFLPLFYATAPMRREDLCVVQRSL